MLSWPWPRRPLPPTSPASSLPLHQSLLFTNALHIFPPIPSPPPESVSTLSLILLHSTKKKPKTKKASPFHPASRVLYMVNVS